MAFHHDYETFSDQRFGGPKSVGMYRYTRSPAFEILMLGYAMDDAPPKLWVPKELFDLEKVRFMVSKEYRQKLKHFTHDDSEIRAAFANPAIEKHAHNAEFERLCTQYANRWRLPDWCEYRCSAALCSTLALPRGLDAAAEGLGLKGKDKGGKSLINKFCKPRKPTKKDDRTRIMPMDEPELFIDFGMYCIQDVEVERAVEQRLKPFALSPEELKVWQMNCEANERGIPIDIENVGRAWSVVEQYMEIKGGELLAETGFRVTQREKIKNWLGERGLELPNMQGDTLDEVLAKIKTGELKVSANVAKVVDIYRTAGRSSIKKLKSMLEFTNAENRVNETSVYHGAQPGRYTGKFIQPHNFARPSRAVGNTMTAFDIVNTGDLETVEMYYNDPMEAVSSTLRHYIKAGDDKELMVADFTGVEARGICWLAGQDDALEAYRKGEDRYLLIGASLNGIDPIDLMIWYKTKWHPRHADAVDIRQFGKLIILGCGYQMGTKKFKQSCEDNYNVIIDIEDAKKAVQLFRKMHAKVVQLWHDVGEAALRAIRTKKTQRVGKLLIGVKDIFLFIKLPSGRKIAYPFPKIEKLQAPWDFTEIEDLREEYRATKNKERRNKIRDKIRRVNRRPPRDTVTYWGKPRQGGGKWVRRSTYGGKLCQNITEAVCRDLLVNGMVQAEPHGIDYIMLVHDELVNEVDEGSITIEQYNEIICNLPKWAKGFPLAADGYIAKHYRK